MTPVVLVILLATISGATATHYHIVPINYTHLCHDYADGTCFTLDELSSRDWTSLPGNITLSFLPGEHILTQRTTFGDSRVIHRTADVILTREQHNSNNKSSKLTCLENTGFDFRAVRTLTIEGLEISGCKRGRGGAVYVNGATNLTIRDCWFTGNQATVHGGGGGGAVYVYGGTNVIISRSHFTSNRVTGYSSGGAVYVDYVKNVTIRESNFTGNQVTGYGGGAVSVNSGTIVSIVKCMFSGNQATGDNSGGGAVYMRSVTSVPFRAVNINNCQFLDNQAAGEGGAVFVFVYSTTLFISACDFNGNKVTAGYSSGGGAVYVHSVRDVSLQACKFFSNRMSGDISHGGAIYVLYSPLYSSGNVYMNNTCYGQGGAVHVVSDSTYTSSFTDDIFTHNKAGQGAAINQKDGHIVINNSTLTNNRQTLGDSAVVYLQQATLIVEREVSFMDNLGSLYLFRCIVEFHGKATFTNNTGESGGAITSIASMITFQMNSDTTISRNTASYGGGLYLELSTMNALGSILITENSATISGGGIFVTQSDMVLGNGNQATNYYYSTPDIQHTNLTSNLALSDGGGMYLTSSSITLSNSFLNLLSNTAKTNGGGIYLDQVSNIDINKHRLEYIRGRNNLFVKLEFTNNTALYGGAVYVSAQCEKDEKRQKQCFLQTLKQYNGYPYTVINTYFNGNSAVQSGSGIYGGLLDRCTINPSAEIFSVYLQNQIANGIQYINVTARFDSDNGPVARNADLSHHISSDAVRVCFCLKGVVNCNHTYPQRSVKKGDMFTLSVVAMDQVRNLVNTTVISSLYSEGNGIERLKEGQQRQPVENKCTELQFNVFSTSDAVKLRLYANGSCGNRGISTQELDINILPCDCPVGFQESQESTQIDCVCDCDTGLKQHVSSCSSESETIQVVNNLWIQYVNSSNVNGFVIHDCLFDYCVAKPINISLNSSSEADQQCAFSRTGKLCGKCEEGLSLVFASSRCITCSNYYLFLVFPFALAGIALVVLILLLNMTVASGTINGLIFYANILAANRPIFLPFDTPNPLTVFISWLNLDLGIVLCFYDGMDSYGKVLLQLVFPAYLIFLIAIIIILCERSQRVSTLLGKRNPVATLCTLILLSYSKLLRTIIAALQSTTLAYPDYSRETVWLYDANVPYFTASHIPRFLAAFFIIIIGAIYTILLLFGQVFYRCSNQKGMKWVSHPKYDSFIKEYHAPLSPKHRYWVGLLLLARIIHYLISAFASNPIVILSAGVIATGLVLLKLRNERIYKNWVIDNLETSFLFNLSILSLATFYVIVVGGNQQALANTSMTVSFITFFEIVVYHSLEKCLDKGSLKLRGLYQTVKDGLKRCCKYPPAREENRNAANLAFESVGYVELDLVQNSASNSVARPTYHTQPIIRQVINDDQLREPALDLIPVRPEDYNVPPSPRQKQEPTYSVVDI